MKKKHLSFWFPEHFTWNSISNENIFFCETDNPFNWKWKAKKKVEQCAALESINSQRKYYFFHPTNCTVLFWAFSCVWFFCFVWENSLTSLCAEKKTYFFCVIRSLFVSTKLNSEINPHFCILSLLFVASLQIAR